MAFNIWHTQDLDGVNSEWQDTSQRGKVMKFKLEEGEGEETSNT